MIADAGNDGAPSTALIAMTRVLLHACPLSSGTEHLPFCPFQEPLIQPPHIFLGHLNRVLRENTLPGRHMTAFVGVLDPADGNFHYSNACHPYPWRWRKRERKLEPLRDATGQALGIDAQATYHHRRIVIEAGDVLVLYTDGVIAAFNNRRQVFGGAETLEAAIEQAATRGGAESVKHWVRTMSAGLAGGLPPPNDVTLVVVERLA
jgi:serine phosphatase RsbU (regulator of sigma subunit)